jgi:hypothetical protein
MDQFSNQQINSVQLNTASCSLCSPEEERDAKKHSNMLKSNDHRGWSFPKTVLITEVEKRVEVINLGCILINLAMARKAINCENSVSLSMGGLPYEMETKKNYSVIVTISNKLPGSEHLSIVLRCETER